MKVKLHGALERCVWMLLLDMMAASIYYVETTVEGAIDTMQPNNANHALKLGERHEN